MLSQPSSSPPIFSPSEHGEEEAADDIRLQTLSSAQYQQASNRSEGHHRPPVPRTDISVLRRQPRLLRMFPSLEQRWRNASSLRYSTSFFLFGLLNNSLYVVILTAALALLPKGVPTGVVAFFNIFPALIAKALWPYLLKGEVRYRRRVWSCTWISFVGMLIIAHFPALSFRLLGIALASFSSGLGELTFLQLSTRYKIAAGQGVSWFASGTGAAGLVGALAWWIVRPLGVELGLSILSFLPWIMLAAYEVLLPGMDDMDEWIRGLLDRAASGSANGAVTGGADEDDEAEGLLRNTASQDEHLESEEEAAQAHRTPQRSAPLSTSDQTSSTPPKVQLTFSEKMVLLKPMLPIFIIPLVLVYLFEYTINQGIAPTLLYPLPTKSNHPVLALVIRRLSDYYPLYQLTYQTFVFISRSSISIFRLPPIPKNFLWAPALIQGLLLIILTTESIYAWFRQSIASPVAIVLVGVEGLAGGAAYVSVFYQIGSMSSPITPKENRYDRIPAVDADGDDEVDENGTTGVASSEDVLYQQARAAQEHEFRIGCVGVGDTMGILIASIIAMPLELKLCAEQVRRGRTLCKQV